jgi:hypothetical protein
MKILDDWKTILKKAWSIRLMLMAGILSGIEVVLPLFIDTFPRGVFAILSILFTGAAFVARIMAQKVFRNDNRHNIKEV